MTMTDPIADMLTRVRNANVAMHDTVRMPSSKLKEALAVHFGARGLHRRLHDRCSVRTSPATCSRSRSSTPPSALRVIGGPEAGLQARPADLLPGRWLPRVLGGLGVAVLSTSKGLMTDREARQQRVGGEVLCYVW